MSSPMADEYYLNGTYYSKDGYSKDNEEDFIVGDRVWVDGYKPGYIQYIGETHFADGDWAGVVLDEPTGRNAGSVGGRRYFYCEPKRGLFARLNRLSRYPVNGKSSPDSGIGDTTLRRMKSLTINERPVIISEENYKTRNSFHMSGVSPTRYRSLSPSPYREKPQYYTLPTKPTKTITTVTTATTTVDGPYKPGPLRIGDKVFVNSKKGLLTGRLRFLGSTEFGPGHWAGVELDEPMGKNDGQVAGRRYFSCKPHYGLFTQCYKVVKADPNRMTTITQTTRDRII